MAVRKSINPRKAPVQDRSRRTVEAILVATAQVLVRQGYEKTTTATVAERAGVSIGTLYQYFPNKESLVAALVRAHVEELFDMIDKTLLKSRDLPLEESMSNLLRAGLDAHRLNPALHKVLTEEMPRTASWAKTLDVSKVLQDKLAAELQCKAVGLKPAQARMMAFVLETCVEALTHRAVVDGPDWLKSGALEREASTLLTQYLRASL